MSTHTDQLDPCPFCRSTWNSDTSTLRHEPRCALAVIDDDQLKQISAERWNRRAISTQAHTDQLAACRAEFEKEAPTFFYENACTRRPSGTYVDLDVERSWALFAKAWNRTTPPASTVAGDSFAAGQRDMQQRASKLCDDEMDWLQGDGFGAVSLIQNQINALSINAASDARAVADEWIRPVGEPVPEFANEYADHVVAEDMRFAISELARISENQTNIAHVKSGYVTVEVGFVPKEACRIGGKAIDLAMKVGITDPETLAIAAYTDMIIAARIEAPAQPEAAWAPKVTNEMKARFIGEFSWKEEAPYYDEDGGYHEHEAERVVPWDLCKRIYKEMASFANTTPPKPGEDAVEKIFQQCFDIIAHQFAAYEMGKMDGTIDLYRRIRSAFNDALTTTQQAGEKQT